MNWLLLPAASLVIVSSSVDLFRQDPGEYVGQREFISPIGGVHFVADVIVTHPQVDSYDYDHCPHSAINTLAYGLVIDPVTGYVEAPERFGLPTYWDSRDLARIVGEPKFSRAAPEGWPWAGAYPWEKYENAARLAFAAERPKTERANFWLLAAWSVRLDFALGPGEFRDQVEAVLSAMPPVAPEPGELYTVYELELADYWAQLDRAGLLSGQDRAHSALAIGWMYRSRGELLAAEHWIGIAALEAPGIAGEEGGIYSYLRSSMALERDYLRSANRLFSEAWTEGSVAVASEGGTAFLLGEINRRLGKLSDAVYWYDLAQANYRGAVSLELVERQRSLAVEGRGY